jgi:hypothetical protein
LKIADIENIKSLIIYKVQDGGGRGVYKSLSTPIDTLVHIFTLFGLKAKNDSSKKTDSLKLSNSFTLHIFPL